MLGAFLRIADQFLRERFVFRRRFAARPRAGNRADGDDAVAQAHENLRAGADNGESRKGKVVEEG